MDALETKGRVELHRWPRESCCTWGDSRFASSRQLVCDKSKDRNPTRLILIPFPNQPPAARFFCYPTHPGGKWGEASVPEQQLVPLVERFAAMLADQPV